MSVQINYLPRYTRVNDLIQRGRYIHIFTPVFPREFVEIKRESVKRRTKRAGNMGRKKKRRQRALVLALIPRRTRVNYS